MDTHTRHEHNYTYVYTPRMKITVSLHTCMVWHTSYQTRPKDSSCLTPINATVASHVFCG